MKKGPLGVWFSIALVIFGLCAWAGFAMGSKYAGYRYRQRHADLEKSYSPERARLESDLSQFRSMDFLKYLVRATQTNSRAQEEYLHAQIAMLEKQAQQPDTQRIKDVIELNLGLAYVEEAMAEEQDGNKEQARRDMTSAQAIFISLGWKDYSEETLRTVARNEFRSLGEKPAEGKAGR